MEESNDQPSIIRRYCVNVVLKKDSKYPDIPAEFIGSKFIRDDLRISDDFIFIKGWRYKVI